MSSDRRAVLFHKGRQSLAKEVFQRIMPMFGQCLPVDAETSLELHAQLLQSIEATRRQPGASVHRFDTCSAAIRWLVDAGVFGEHGNNAAISSLLLVGEAPCGFFRGSPPWHELMVVLGNEVESATIVPLNGDDCFVIDVATDDPLRGDFVEVEVLPISPIVRSLLRRAQSAEPPPGHEPRPLNG